MREARLYFTPCHFLSISVDHADDAVDARLESTFGSAGGEAGVYFSSIPRYNFWVTVFGSLSPYSVPWEYSF